MSLPSLSPTGRAPVCTPRTHRLPSLPCSLLLFACLTWFAACTSDVGAPTASLADIPRTRAAPPTGAYHSIGTILRELEAVAESTTSASLMRSTVVHEGREQELRGILAIRTAVRRAHQANAPDLASTGHESFAIPADDSDSLRIVFPMSILLTEPSRFRFLSYTSINKLGMARFSFSGSRTVLASSGHASTLVWTDQGTRTVTESDGDAVVEWPDFLISSGCDFLGTMNTRHDATWPWGFVIPGFVPRVAPFATTGASSPLHRDCSGDAAPPPPPPPSPSDCIDPALAGCEGGNGGSGRSGATQQREVGRSGGSKTVCWVTDWYENGAYLETTIDYCWTELIY